jgi:pimeloyl-ACP methyl ester carboxylesterase
MATGSSQHRVLYATEPVRALADACTLVAALPLIRHAPRGEPHPVLVLPGLHASDTSTTTLRRWIRRLGHPVAGWELGRNRGPTRAVVDGLPALLDTLVQRHGEPITLVGWSLGGIFARSLALRRPTAVRQVITLGSPFGIPEDANVGTPGERMYQPLAHLHVQDRIHPSGAVLREPLAVPSTAVYSRWDGIVDWRDCLQRSGPTSENVEVRGSHLGLGHHPAVLWTVADRLAQPTDQWRPFQIPERGPLAALFGATAAGDVGGVRHSGQH